VRQNNVLKKPIGPILPILPNKIGTINREVSWKLLDKYSMGGK
jgi:hypothetical protein